MADVQTIQLVDNDSQENRKLGTYLRVQFLPSYLFSWLIVFFEILAVL